MSPLLRGVLCFVFLLSVQPGRGQAPPKNDSMAQFYRDTEPEKDKDTGLLIPPGPPIPEVEANSNENKSFKFKNGKTAKLDVATWGWNKTDGPKGAPQWQLFLAGTILDSTTGPAMEDFPADQFDPSEAEHIRKAIWKYYYFVYKIESQRVEYTKEAESWLDRIAAYTGKEPCEKGKPWLPQSSEPRMRQAPDFRKLCSWDLRKGNRKERAARFQVLDWAMQEPLKLSECDIYLYGKGAAIPVRVRYEDGTEETLAASWIGENHGWGFFHMALWNDWARLLREGGEIPHRDLKIRALKDTLPELWFRELRQHAPVKGPGVVLAPLEPIDAADFAERSKGFRQGEALSFPGLPPAGFVRISEHPMDREKLGSGFPPGPAGAGARQCLGFGMAAWMNTWHSTHLVSVDGVTDFGGEEWFYARVPKEMPPPQRNAIYWPVFAKRINDYAAGLYRKQAILQVHYDLDYSPANMMRYTQGMDAVFLCLTVVEGRNQTGGIAVPLLEASDDGSVTLGGFGQVLTAKIAESKDGHLSSFGAVKGKLPAMEVVITGAKEPAMKKLKNVRLLLESNFQDGIIAVTPFVRGKAPVVPRARKPAPVR